MIDTRKTLNGQGSISLWHLDGDETRITDVAGISKGRMPDGKARPKLLRHLLEQRHMTPFESVQTHWIVECPIYVARQWMRHRTWSVNERSLRCCESLGYYTPLGAPLGYDDAATKAKTYYGIMLSYDAMPREQARGVLPLATMTQFWGAVDLRNLLGFVELRDEEHAQAEIREYALAIKSMLRDRLPTVAETLGW